MSAVTFDTLEFVNTLKSAGMPAEQAEAVSVAVRKAQDSADVARRGEMATKGDIADVKGDVVRLNAKIDVLDAKVDALGSKFDHLKWLTGAVLVAVLAPLVKSMF